MCGEHWKNLPPYMDERGSSPRVRGTPGSTPRSRSRCGIIPACAGNTPSKPSSQESRGDHPRVCGEHSILNAAARASTGSSPRVRGTPRATLRSSTRFGIIPACAGNTTRHNRACIAVRDHPRVCGEHCGYYDRGYHPPGSSPRVRGTLSACGHQAEEPGIIPACAGNTLASHEGLRHARDHPRVCGEHTKKIA